MKLVEDALPDSKDAVFYAVLMEKRKADSSTNIITLSNEPFVLRGCRNREGLECPT